jgi:hypothetical protein
MTKIFRILTYITLVNSVLFVTSCSKKASIDAICLKRLEVAVSEVRKIVISYETNGLTQDELRELSNNASFALRDALDLWKAKGQVAHELGINDLDVLIDQWVGQMNLISSEKLSIKRQRSVVFIRLATDPNTKALWVNENRWDDNTSSNPSTSPNLSFCELRNLLIKYPSIKSTLTYYDDGKYTAYPETVLQELINFTPSPYPSGQKIFFDSFEKKYFPKKYGWYYNENGGVRDFQIYYDPKVIVNAILFDLSEKSRELDLKIKSKLSN